MSARAVGARSTPKGGWGSQVATSFHGDIPLQAGRQWNRVWRDGDMFKGGFGGQGLYVSPGRDLVIAFFGTAEKGRFLQRSRWMSRTLATSLFQIGGRT